MARKEIYNQRNNKVLWNGVALTGYAPDTSISVEFVGGEVDITEGTDGGGLNIATTQGIRITLSLRETSPSADILNSAIELQQLLSSSGVVMLQTGANVKYTVTNALVSKPDTLSTGGKTQGSQTYTFVGTQYIAA
jgi:hypothetical protein